MIPQNQKLDFSGERFIVDYLLSAPENEVRDFARSVCVEQTVEFPEDLVPVGDIREKVVGRLESLEQITETTYRASISYAVELTGGDFVQFLNVMFGNCSLMAGLRIVGLTMPPSILQRHKGPRFGRAGVRELLAIGDRPILATAIKPQGLSSEELADQTGQFALGGIDVIKDDHGLCDQEFSPFRERVSRCSAAIRDANEKTGFKTIYMPSISGPADKVLEWAHFAKDVGAGALLLSAGLVGWDVFKLIAEDDTVGLPVMSHPTFMGSFVTSPNNGMSHGVIFGTLTRLAGADLTVFPNYGGRFSFSQAECAEIADATAAPLGDLKQSFPAPGGGMTLDRIDEIIDFYNREVALLVGGGLHRGDGTLTERCLRLRRTVEPS